MPALHHKSYEAKHDGSRDVNSNDNLRSMENMSKTRERYARVAQKTRKSNSKKQQMLLKTIQTAIKRAASINATKCNNSNLRYEAYSDYRGYEARDNDSRYEAHDNNSRYEAHDNNSRYEAHSDKERYEAHNARKKREKH